jgi:formylglycine-generating enzyme required for sulfatase activity
MSKADGRAYRLLTEAEWEYACRAGTATPFCFGESIASDQGNFNGNHPYGRQKRGLARKRTTPVSTFPANAWGLHDMHGNVWQWCADWYDDYPHAAVVDPQGPFQEAFDAAPFIRALSSLKFEERQAATKALRDIGPPALPALRKAATQAPDLETQRRAEQLIAALTAKGEYRVLRGGSFTSPAALVRSANRSGLPPESRNFDVGFRVAVEAGNVKPAK